MSLTCDTCKRPITVGPITCSAGVGVDPSMVGNGIGSLTEVSSPGEVVGAGRELMGRGLCQHSTRHGQLAHWLSR